MGHPHYRSVIQRDHLNMRLLQILHGSSSSPTQALTNGWQSGVRRSVDFVRIVGRIWTGLTQNLYRPRLPSLPGYPITCSLHNITIGLRNHHRD